ncbi:MAG: hypothetical protein LBP63_01215 [Prevotellaceae bacterium]|jgi:hypothetical protein|nr:hypothetical protein [Prevotellaceae bacterium]
MSKDFETIWKKSYKEEKKDDFGVLKLLYNELVPALKELHNNFIQKQKDKDIKTLDKIKYEYARNCMYILNKHFISISCNQNNRYASDFAQITNSHINQLQNHLFAIANEEASNTAWKYFHWTTIVAIITFLITLYFSIKSYNGSKDTNMKINNIQTTILDNGSKNDKKMNEIQTSIYDINNKLDSIKTDTMPAQKSTIKVK